MNKVLADISNSESMTLVTKEKKQSRRQYQGYLRRMKLIYAAEVKKHIRREMEKYASRGEPLPEYLAGLTDDYIEDLILRSLEAFEYHGEISSKDMRLKTPPRSIKRCDGKILEYFS